MLNAEMKTKRFAPSERQSILDERRNLKMARSAHAYVRGNTQKFYEWLESAAGKLIPEGPPVWICGDCHIGNIGPVANVKGRVEMAIRDLDQTVIGNPAHDLVRLGLSLATSARGSDLPGVTTAAALEQMIEGYEAALANRSADYKDFERMPKPIRLVIKQAMKREWRHLAEERIENVKPSIPLGKCFWALSDKERREIDGLFEAKEAHQLVTSFHSREDRAKIRVVDAAYWMKGCSSLGRLRYAVLLRVGRGGYQDGGLCLIDIKEATKAVAPRAEHSSMPRNNAKRVVEGARKLSPFLGERMLATSLLGHDVFIRELLPQDLKLELDQLSHSEAIAAARFLAMVIGKAHGRQMDVATRKKWLAELSRNRSKSLDAPSWLWRSVVELVSSHEAAYLDHCRLFAMSKTA
jgi:uncharacterized protein (DUF2252 family)